VVTLTIVLAELLSVLYGDWFHLQGGVFHELLDGTVLLGLTLPSLAYFFAKPLAAALREKALAEAALQEVCQGLEEQVRDRTARLGALNESLQASEAKYRSMLENSPTGIFILWEGRIVFGNTRFFDILHRGKEELPQLVPAQLVHPEDLPDLDLARAAPDAGETGWNCDFRVITATGEVRWVSGRFAPVPFMTGTALLGNVLDITDHHQAEAAVRESREALRMLSALRFTLLEEDRRRVARELHDGIGQSLTAIKIMVERAIGGPCWQPQGEAGELLPAVVPLLQQTVEEIRGICMDLRPSILDDLGLVATLRWLVREFQRTHPAIELKLTVRVDEAEIPKALKTSIFRISQEALNNIAKHAGASRVSVAFHASRGFLRLLILDDGVGLGARDAGPADRSGGLGLASMRERAEHFGGTLAVFSAGASGTTVAARWPLPGGSGEPAPDRPVRD
jgi:PAS domain S-box-containing protein